jgi:uncharacterized protein (TIGR02569 family)
VGTPPPRPVLNAFGASGEATALSGGEGVAFRAGSVVVKRVHDVAEASWTQATLAGIDQHGFRVPTPLTASNGDWVHDGWVASEFVPDLRPVAPRWADVIECGLRFGDAAERARPTQVDVLEDRTHRWAIAERVAWQEARVDLAPAAAGVGAALARLLAPHPDTERRFVHGDLTGNVFLDGTDEFVVLDVSPYLRHRRWAAAIVVADAVLWHDADMAMAEELVADPADRDLLGRALIFRLVAEQLATDPRHGALMEPFRRVIARLL